MATTPLESVMHYKKKLDKNPDDEVILSVIHKLSKIPITVEILEVTHIGKCIRNLSKRDDAVGNKAKIVLKKWRDVFVNVMPDKSSEFHSNHKETSREHKNSSHKKESEKSSKKRVDRANHANNSAQACRSLNKSEVKKESHPKYKDYDPFADVAEGYDPGCPELFPSGNKAVRKDTHISETYTPSRKRKHSKAPDSEAGSELSSKKLKHAKDSISSLDSSKACKSPEKKDKQHSRKDKCSRESHSVSAKKTSSPSVKLDKDRGSKPKSSSDRKKDTGSADSGGGNGNKLKQTKKIPVQSSVEFTSSNVKFEDCLGFNDIVILKKKKSSPTKPHAPPPQSASTKKSPTKDTKKRVNKKDSSPVPKVKTREESSIKEKPDFESPLPPKMKPDAAGITSTLLEVQPNYRPLPRNPDSFSHKKKDTLSNEDAIMFISSRKEKTAVYSGRKNFCLTEVPSLVNCCTRFLIENIDALECVGDLPYYLLKPVLEKCTPAQLLNIENFNPHLIDETNELWKIHCRRDYKLLSPHEHETWRDLHLRASDERERKLKSITANISANISKSNPARQVKLAYVDSFVKPPRDVARRQAKHGTAVPASIPVKTEKPSKSTPKPTASAPKPAAPVLSSASSSSSVERPSFPPKKPKVAPLMAKTLKSMKQCFRR